MPLRLVILAKRYWPLVGGEEQSLAHLARGVKALGVDVTLLTPRWQPDWPDRLDDHGVRVLRLPHPPRGLWSRRAWRLQLKNWLIAEQANYDLVFVSHLEEEATAALQASYVTRRPFVLRPTQWSEIPSSGLFRQRIRKIIDHAAAFSADGPALCAALTAAGCAREKVFEIPDGVPLTVERSPVQRAAARQELAEADPTLLLEPNAPLALAAGPLTVDRGLHRLIEAWRIVIDQQPSARLWIVGEGPERERLTKQLQTAALEGKVELVSQFDTMESFYQAADLFVQAGTPEQIPYALREAMSAGLACVISDARTSRRIVEPGEQGLVALGESAATLAEPIVQLLTDRTLAEKYGSAARSRALETFDLAKVAQQHVDLWTSLGKTQLPPVPA